MHCPLCEDDVCRRFFLAGAREYWRCERCKATFLHPAQRPSPEEERNRYLLHRNEPDDAGYRRFLSRLATPLLARLPPAQRGLDYGCGPGPVLAMMLRAAGHRIALFDPFFRPDARALTRTYDFVTCTEVAEHFHRPAEEFHRLHVLLKPGGWLALMTRMLRKDGEFDRWDYRSDLTHVVFYREETLRHVAAHHGWHCEILADDVALMRKPLT